MGLFFHHENQGTPPLLSDMGDRRHGTKSDLMGCFESLIAVQKNDMPGASSTFNDYAADVFVPYLITLLQTSACIDVVWDRYI